MSVSMLHLSLPCERGKGEVGFAISKGKSLDMVFLEVSSQELEDKS